MGQKQDSAIWTCRKEQFSKFLGCNISSFPHVTKEKDRYIIGGFTESVVSYTELIFPSPILKSFIELPVLTKVTDLIQQQLELLNLQLNCIRGIAVSIMSFLPKLTQFPRHLDMAGWEKLGKQKNYNSLALSSLIMTCKINTQRCTHSSD